jgi:hypothetical protein
MPWTILARASSTIPLVRPQRIEPRVKTPIAARKTVRAPKRSATQPLMGMKIPRLNI